MEGFIMVGFKHFTLALLAFIALGTASAYAVLSSHKKDPNYLLGGNIVYKGGDVLGITSEERSASIDFSRQTAQLSPLLFGGAHAPDLSHRSAWESVQSVGVTSLRSDFFLDRYIPYNITLEDYKQNKNNVQDPAKWNQTVIQKEKQIYQEARRRNMKTVGILTYAVKWLTHSNSNYGVPRDWAVFEDLVAKSYALFRDDLDYLELWNEPDMSFFLDVKGSGLSQEEAYYQIVQHSVKAIRKVDQEKNDGKRIPLGIGVTAKPTSTSYLTKILADKTLISEIDFVSYHNYEHMPEPSNVAVKNELAKYGQQRLPIFLTEWSHTPNIKQKDDYVLTTAGIPYTGSKFIDFMNMGLAGANYFALQQIMPNSPRGDEGFLGFYEIKDGSVQLLPLAKTWSLMSKSLGLGAGTGKVFQTHHENDFKIAAWQNSQQKYGLVLSNPTGLTTTYNISATNLPLKGKILLSAYGASEKLDGTKKIGSVVVSNAETNMNFKIVAPATSVIGVTFEQADLMEQLSDLR